jgi:hypothetical protein
LPLAGIKKMFANIRVLVRHTLRISRDIPMKVSHVSRMFSANLFHLLMEVATLIKMTFDQGIFLQPITAEGGEGFAFVQARSFLVFARHTMPEATEALGKAFRAFGSFPVPASCGARRMAETAALLADEVLPERPLRQWVLSLPYALRFLLATDPDSLTMVLGAVYRVISGYLLETAGTTRTTGDTGAVTLIQNFLPPEDPCDVR